MEERTVFLTIFRSPVAYVGLWLAGPDMLGTKQSIRGPSRKAGKNLWQLRAVLVSSKSTPFYMESGRNNNQIVTNKLVGNAAARL